MIRVLIVDDHALVRSGLRLLLEAEEDITVEDEAGNAEDPILALVPSDRRATLIAKRGLRGKHPVYTFDIHMQGGQETVFFEV